MRNILFFSIIILLGFGDLNAQEFDLSGEVRSRFESKNGYKTLQVEDQDAANFISQRTRLNFKYKQSKMNFKVTFQNVRVWGDVGTLSSNDKATALHESWAEAILTDKISLKIGRQEIVYDDHRIFGSVGWAQQARSHDAFLVKFKPNDKSILDIGFALNADSQSGVDQLYSNVAGYKTLQYAWYHSSFNKLGVSLLLMNTGIEFNDALTGAQSIDNMQTLGTRLTFKAGKLSANGSGYFQTGTKNDADVSAFNVGVDLGYKINGAFKIGLGFEQLSGKDMSDTEAAVKSFAPLFGTNHKFNGWMDYFYVGNHSNSVGLSDIYTSFVYTKNKFSAKLMPHLFSAAAKVIDPVKNEEMDSYLGTEIDLALGYKVSESMSINAGYSLMFATETMEVLKTGDKDETNSWAWVMFTFKPNLFSYKNSPPQE